MEISAKVRGENIDDSVESLYYTQITQLIHYLNPTFFSTM